MDAIVTVVATSILISVPVPLIEVKDIEFPDIDIGIGRDPRPVDKPERLPRPSEDPPFPPADKKRANVQSVFVGDTMEEAQKNGEQETIQANTIAKTTLEFISNVFAVMSKSVAKWA